MAQLAQVATTQGEEDTTDQVEEDIIVNPRAWQWEGEATISLHYFPTQKLYNISASTSTLASGIARSKWV